MHQRFVHSTAKNGRNYGNDVKNDDRDKTRGNDIREVADVTTVKEGLFLDDVTKIIWPVMNSTLAHPHQASEAWPLQALDPNQVFILSGR